MLTDSGGFQVFSLASLNAIKERGVTFQSPEMARWLSSPPSARWRSKSSWG